MSCLPLWTKTDKEKMTTAQSGNSDGKFKTGMWRSGGFPDGSDGKESACNAGGWGSIPGSVRSPGEGNGYPLQYSCLGNPRDRGTWRTMVHGIAKTWTPLSDQHFHFHMENGTSKIFSRQGSFPVACGTYRIVVSPLHGDAVPTQFQAPDPPQSHPPTLYLCLSCLQHPPLSSSAPGWFVGIADPLG